MAGEKILMHCCCGPCSSACIERLAPDYDLTLFFYNPCIDDRDEYELRKRNLIALAGRINEKGYVGFSQDDADSVTEQNLAGSDENNAATKSEGTQSQASSGALDKALASEFTPDPADISDNIRKAAAFGITPLRYGPVKVVEGRYDPEDYLEEVAGLEAEPEGGARCAVCFRMRLMETARFAKERGFDGFTTTLTVSPHKNFEVISAIGARVAEETGVRYFPFDFKKKDGFLHSIRLSKAYGLYRQDHCGCGFSKR